MTLSERPIHRSFDRGRKALKKSFFPNLPPRPAIVFDRTYLC
ncbi:hypothetical protein PORCAN_2079 [Porphyromonas crevioricanis JCM 13913]|nr:hypothetical protein PORCAN_2079 [Porphyromonas crevioricanis JCM 13913]